MGTADSTKFLSWLPKCRLRVPRYPGRKRWSVFCKSPLGVPGMAVLLWRVGMMNRVGLERFSADVFLRPGA